MTDCLSKIAKRCLPLLTLFASISMQGSTTHFRYSTTENNIYYECINTKTITNGQVKNTYDITKAFGREGLVHGEIASSIRMYCSATMASYPSVTGTVSYVSGFGIETMESLIIPSTVNEINSGAFENSTALKRLYIYKENPGNISFVESVREQATIFVPQKDVDRYKELFKGEVRTLEDAWLTDVEEEMFSVKFKLNPFAFVDRNATFVKVQLGEDVLSPDADGTYTVIGLEPGQNYTLSVWLRDNRTEKETAAYVEIKTAPVAVSLELAEATQTTLSVKANANTDASTGAIDAYGFIYDDFMESTKYPCTGSVIKLTGLHDDMAHQLIPYFEKGGKTFTGMPVEFRTKSLNIRINVSDITMTSAKITLSYDCGDADINECFINGIRTDAEITTSPKQTFVTDYLLPGLSYTVRMYVNYGDKWQSSRDLQFSTKALSQAINVVLGPTSARAEGSQIKSDEITLSEHKIKLRNGGKTYTVEGTSAVFPGLVPNSEVSAEYSVKVTTPKEATRVYTASFNGKTSELELLLLPVKCVTNSSAVVAATTNISDDEVNAGFQWRKYDAPESLPSSEANAIVSDGLLEGYIHNLQSDFYYKLRAFYRTEAGEYYYTEWTTFDPSDFSYFEPTVRTYEATAVTHNSANVRGYVLRGSDKVIRQGFQYWKNSGASHSPTLAPEQNGIMTVLAEGQVMNATLTDLSADTEYTVRCFAETEAGTVYGEEQTFRTEKLSSITNVSVSSETPEIVGYYDLSGRRYTEPRRGLKIILYSDGTTRKEYVR